MKKIVCLLVALCLTAALFSCTDTPETKQEEVKTPEVTETPNEIASPSENDTTTPETVTPTELELTEHDSSESLQSNEVVTPEEIYIQPSDFINTDDIKEPFSSVLDGTKPIRTDNSHEKVITDIIFPHSGKNIFSSPQLRYSLTDMDSDGIKELLLSDKYGDTLVLRDCNDGVYGKMFGFREMEEIYSDGTFSWNRTDDIGFHFGRAKLEFIDGNYKAFELFRTSFNRTTGKVTYYIGDEPSDSYSLVQYEYDEERFSNKDAEFFSIVKESNEKEFKHLSVVTTSFAPREQSCFPATFEYNGQKITVNEPKFTGIPTDSVSSYKEKLAFENGITVFYVSLEDGWKYFVVDKDGKIVDDNYSGESHIKDSAAISSRGDYAIIMTGVQMFYKQQLSHIKSPALSDIFDSIGFFYNGIAPVVRDGKIGFIGADCQTLLEPCIQFDDLRYPPDYKGYWCYYLCEDAIVLPIDGEFAIINITRE